MRIVLTLVSAILLWAIPAAGQLSRNMQDWLARLNSGEFSGGGGGRGGGRGGAGAPGRWVEGGKGYTATERDPAGNLSIVRYDTATGHRETLMTAAQLTPPASGRPLAFVDYAVSPDGKRMIFATNPRPTMIRKTAYEYWVLDKTDNSWRKLGGDSPSVLYARLSPDGTRAAYVRDNNLFVEEIRTGAIRQLTRDGSATIINGTSDWVYEEEFGLREGFSWSPDGRRIAYFQFDQSGVPEFALINYTDQLYPVITKYRYPKAGQTNSAVRVGVVNAAGGPTTWIQAPGDPRNIYIARMDWAANSNELVLQHLNRLQNTNTVLLADADTGAARPMYRDQDQAWVDINQTFAWLESGKRLLFESERDGWRHAYAVVARRRCAADHYRRIRRDLDRRRGRARRLALLHRVARQRHAAVPVPLATGRHRRQRTRDTTGHEPEPTPTICRRTATGRSTSPRGSMRPASPTWSLCPITRRRASSRTMPLSAKRSRRCWQDARKCSRSLWRAESGWTAG